MNNIKKILYHNHLKEKNLKCKNDKIFTVNEEKQSKLLSRYHDRGHCDPFLHSNTLATGITLDKDRPCYRIIFYVIPEFGF